MYNQIRACAFEHDPSRDPWVEQFHVAKFAEQWQTELTDLYALGWRSREAMVGLPVKHLNQVLRAVAPGVLATGRGAAADPSVPWIYTDGEVPAEVVRAAFLTWVMSLRPEPAHQAALGRVLDSISGTAIEWLPVEIDLTSADLSAGGTALPPRRLYSLLPELVATRLAQRSFRARESDGETRFRVVNRDQGTELVAWPPRSTPFDGGGHFYSAVVRFTCHTVPFTARLRVHVSTGIRRWVAGDRLFLPHRRSATVLVDTPSPWGDGGSAARTRLSVNSIRYDARQGRVVWGRNSPVGLLGDLDVIGSYPKAEEVVSSPKAWLTGRAGKAVGIVHSTALETTHAVGTGLMPDERAELDEWVAEGLKPLLRRVPDLVRVSRVRNKPALLPVAPKTKPEQRERFDRQVEANRRRGLRAALAGDPLHVDVVTIFPESADRILREFARQLGCPEEEVTTEVRQRWFFDGLEVRLTVSSLGNLARKVDVPKPGTPQSAAAVREAHRARRLAAGAALPRLDAPAIALVELPGGDRFTEPNSDPKSALRLGFADSGRLTQFIRPLPGSGDDVDERVRSACLDAFRQLGVFTSAEPRTRSPLPTGLQYVGLWVVRGTQGRRLVAVRVRPGEEVQQVTAWDDRVKDWVPYQRFLLTLATADASFRAKGRRSAEDDRLDVERRIRSILYQSRDRPTLLLVNSGNLRESWPSLANGSLMRDHLGFTGIQDQRVGAYGEELRVVLVRDRNIREEVPQWYAPTPEGKPAGFASGLWCPKDAANDNRVFASTADLPGSFPKTPRGLRKLGDDVPSQYGATVPAWNPQYLEITSLCIASSDTGSQDSAAEWASVAHQQRFHNEYDPLAQPFPVHLAKKAEEYCFSTESTEEEVE
ncbi:pPIWI_RE module domain-containing protein [Amycolatopsis thailandensis]|uniref:pPIWI_RE module domain-containing protein n=1 Tax=Amycolatopsis thailandensis TaxID=589330 RepID=UPI0037A1D842